MKKLSVRLALVSLSLVPAPATAFANSHQTLTHLASRQSTLSPAAAARTTIDKFLTRLAKQHLFMGSVLVADASGAVLRKGYGFSNWEQHVPNTPATKFRLSDATLQFTAAAVLQLQDARKLSLRDRACRYIAACPTAWSNVTIQQLLNHTSGIPDLYNDGVTGFYGWKYWTPAQIIGFVQDAPLLFKPGTDWHYSEINYIALGLIVEKASGQAFGTYLHDHLFQPLGMTHSGLARKGETVPGLARGYDGYPRVVQSIFNPNWTFSAGGVYSTVGDMYLWDQALRSGNIVSKTSLNDMLTPSFAISKDVGYGYGWQIENFSGHHLIADGGGMPGVSTLNAVFPDDGVTIILLTNNDQTAMNVVFPYLADAILGIKGSQ